MCDAEEEVRLFDLIKGGAPRVISLLEPGKKRPASAPATDKAAPAWAHAGWASGPAAFSQDGKRLAVYLYEDHALREVSVEDGRFLRRIAVPPNDDLGALAYTGDGGSFIYGASERIVCFDPALGRAIAEVRWAGYFSRISASRDNRVCLVDDYAAGGFFMRPASPSGMAELQAAARRKLDSHHNAIPFVPAENETSITAPDLFLAQYWAGWWEVERRLKEADANPEAVLAQPTLAAIHEPLRQIFEANSGRLPAGMETMRTTLEMLKPLAAVPREEELKARLMFIEGRSPIERIILLIDLLNRLDARAPQRASASVMLAGAYADRIEEVEWRGTSLEKEAQTTAAMQALQQAVDLGYADWKRVTGLLSGRDIRTDGRYVALLERIVLALPADAPDRAAAFAAAGYGYAKRVQDEDWDGQEAAKKQAVDKAYSLMQQAVGLGYRDWQEIHWQFDRFDYESDLHTDPRLPGLLSSILEKLPAGDAERPKVMAEIAATHARRVEKMEWTAAQSAEKNAEIQKSVTLLKQAIAAGFKDWESVSSDFSDEVQSDPAFPLELLPEKELVSLVGRTYGIRTRNAYQQTIRLADAVFARGSRAFQALYYKGAALSRLERFADAVPVLKEAVPLAPDSAWKSAAYRELAAAERHLGPSGLADALPDATRAVELADGSIRPSALAARARIYFEMSQDDKAMDDLDKIVQDNPDDADAWDWKGSVMLQYPRERLMDEAAAAYTRAIALTKDRGDMDDYLEQRSIAYRYGGRFNEALADMRAVLRNNPDNLNVIYDLGIVRAAQGYPQEAIAHYTRALTRWPEDQWLYARRGLARLQTGDLPGARADFAAAMRFDDSDDCGILSDYMDVICDAPVSLAAEAEAMLVKTPGAGESLARLRLKQGKNPEAAAILARLLRDQPARIIYRAYAGQFDGAIDDATRYYRQDQRTSARAMTCAVALLARAGDPQASAEKKREDVARALFYLGRFTGGNNNNAYELQHNWDFRAVADDPAFAQLAAAQKQPDDKPNRAFERARFFAQAHARIKALNPAAPAPEEIALAYDAIFEELARARKLGLDAAAIADHADFASIRNDPRYAELIKP
jgi:tetratricopeptide (TPR) repeat protein